MLPTHRIKQKNHSNLWQILGLRPGAGRTQVDKAYGRNIKILENKELRLAWKILRDPLYASAYNYYSDPKIIEEAGFFDDRVNLGEDFSERFDPRFLTTPLHKILQNLKKDKQEKLAVLLSTGAFFPLHKGHLDMMRIAKGELEQRGFSILGGFYSPSHQNYLIKKYGKINKKLIADRLFLCQKTVKDSDWLEIDPWEARYNKTYINFTEVILRLESYLKFHLPSKSIDVFYVFGGDNINFSKAFIKKGKAICVPRDHYKNFEPFLKGAPELSRKKTIIFAKESVIPLISSSQVRLKSWKEEKILKASEEKGLYVIRNDAQWCIEPWLKESRQKYLKKEVNIFFKAFENKIKEKLSGLKGIKVQPIDLKEQLKISNEGPHKKRINLDPCIPRQYNLMLSRLFAISSNQIKGEKIVARPGSPTIKNQLNLIPKGNYDLIDDDIASGQTIELVSNLLKEKVKIQKVESLLETTFKSSEILKKLWIKVNRRIFDVVDFRDFLFGSKHSGLVVALPNGKIARAPYTLPYVSLVTRAKIPTEKEVKFSLELWEMNLKFFNKIQPAILLSETNMGFQKLMLYLGFKKKDKMEDICSWHLNNLKLINETD